MNNKKAVEQAKTIVVNKSVISTAGLITVLLVILKVTNNIDISWWWVFAPYWIPFSLVIGFILLFMIGALFIGFAVVLFEAWDNYDRNKYK